MGHYPVESIASSGYSRVELASSLPSDWFCGDCHGAGDIGAKVQQVAVEQLVGLTGRELEPSLRWTSDGCAVAGASIADSSLPSGLGSMYWAPAIFGEKNYLRFTDPRRLTIDDPSGTPVARPKPVPVDPDAFGAGERPETPARLRKPPQPAEG